MNEIFYGSQQQNPTYSGDFLMLGARSLNWLG